MALPARAGVRPGQCTDFLDFAAAHLHIPVARFDVLLCAARFVHPIFVDWHFRDRHPFQKLVWMPR